MVLRSNAAHQPSLRRSITWPPQSFSPIKRSGMSLSSISMTSSRQQQALQLLQLMAWLLLSNVSDGTVFISINKIFSDFLAV